MWQIAANQKISENYPERAQEVAFTDDFKISKNIESYPDNIASMIILALAEKKVK